MAYAGRPTTRHGAASRGRYGHRCGCHCPSSRRPQGPDPPRRCPFRPRQFVEEHTPVSQPYDVSKRAGHQTSAESSCSWRRHPPRRPGCIWQHVPWWPYVCTHRRVDINMRRYAVASALAATAVPSLVLARGHRIESVPEIPLGVEKNATAIKVLKQIGAFPDVEKSKDCLKIRPGKGKMRNRRYVTRKRPLIVYGTEGSKIVKAFRNIPGIDIANVDRLNLLKLAILAGSSSGPNLPLKSWILFLEASISNLRRRRRDISSHGRRFAKC